jgi:hypothetical protein
MEFRCKICGKSWWEWIPFDEGRMEFTICERCLDKLLNGELKKQLRG